MFEDLKIFGKALQNYGDEKKDKEEEKPLLKEYDEFLKAKEEYEPTKEQEEAGSIEDYGTQSTLDILLEKEKSDKGEKDLDKKNC
jgi:predicted metal-binding protein